MASIWSIFTLGIIALLVTEAFDAIAGLFLMPVLPFHFEDDGLSPLQINAISIVPMITGGIAQGVLGQASDRSGRKGILMMSLVLESLSYVAMALYYEPPLTLVIILAVQGAAAGTDAVINAYISDNVLEENRPLVMQVKTTVKALGASVGSGVGAVLYSWLGWEGMSFCLASGCAIQLVVGGAFWNRKGAYTKAVSTDAAAAAGSPAEQKPSGRGVQHMLGHYCDPNIGPLLVLGMVTLSGMMAAMSCLPYLLKDQFGWGPKDYGFFLGSLAFVIFAFTQIASVQVRVFGERACIAIANLLSAFVGAWLVFAATFKLTWGPWLFVMGVFFQVPLNIAATCWLNRLAPEEIRGEVNGVFGAGSALCGAIVGPLSSWVYERYWWAPYIASSIVLIVSLPLVALPVSSVPEADPKESLLLTDISSVFDSPSKSSPSAIDVLNNMSDSRPTTPQQLYFCRSFTKQVSS